VFIIEGTITAFRNLIYIYQLFVISKVIQKQELES